MAFKILARTREKTGTTGTGDITVSGLVSADNVLFSSGMSVGDTAYMCVVSGDGIAWEEFLGTYSAANTIQRTTTITNNLGTTAHISLSGTSRVFAIIPSDFTAFINSLGGGSTTNFLRGDGTFAAPSGGGSGTLAGDTDVSISGAANNDFLEYQTSDSLWHNRTPTQATAALIAVVGDTGSGGTKGLVPAPGSGDAAAGKFLKADATWAAPAGGASVPTSASTGLTTWANQGSATVADTSKGISINAPSNGAAYNWRLRYKTAPSTPFAIKARIALTNDFANNHYAQGGIGFYDGTKLEGITLELSNTTSTQIGYTTNATVGIGTSNSVLDIIAVPNPIWLGLVDDGTNVTIGYSVDGDDFFTIHSAGLPDFLSAMTDIYFGLNPYGSAASIVMLDYVELAGSVTAIPGGFRF